MTEHDGVARHGAADATLPTVGVEEEFLTVDPATQRPVPLASDVLARVPAVAVSAEFKGELLASQIETASTVTSGLAELRAGLRDSRTALASAAAAVGADLHSAGFALDHTVPLAVSRDERYRAIEERYAGVTADYPACGCHVHVGVPDRETAVAVVNHLRPWLPTLLALSANSPYARGVDSGCASWRAVSQRRFPGAGVPPWCADAAAYDRAMDAQLAAGATVDRQMTFWYARPSEHVPTVEVRAADAAATVDEAVLQAGLTRALVVRALHDLAAGRTAPPTGDAVAAAAVWAAARYGLDGPAVDFADGRTTSALSLVGKLLTHAAPGLEESGDGQLVRTYLHRIVRQGTGAARQRRAAARGGLAAAAGVVAIRPDPPPEPLAVVGGTAHDFARPTPDCGRMR